MFFSVCESWKRAGRTRVTRGSRVREKTAKGLGISWDEREGAIGDAIAIDRINRATKLTTVPLLYMCLSLSLPFSVSFSLLHTMTLIWRCSWWKLISTCLFMHVLRAGSLPGFTVIERKSWTNGHFALVRILSVCLSLFLYPSFSLPPLYCALISPELINWLNAGISMCVL